MIEPRLKLAETIFGELLDTPRDRRPSLLAERCAGDDALRSLVESLLNFDDSGMAGFLTHPVLEQRRWEPAPPGRIGRYEVVRELGRGGAGVVYEARQDQPGRLVALKVLNQAFAASETLRRFEHETEILGRLHHPGIAQVYEAGTAEFSGPLGQAIMLPWFAMERVAGEPITAFCDRHELSLTDRLRLFAQACGAVQHAHSKGVIHRDIKPSNVLAGMDGECPFCKVIDFGVAKLAPLGGSADAPLTQARQLIGTPEYMSPEQAAGSRDVDTRSDVYSLGALLYELLAGAPPFETGRLRQAEFGEMQRIIREVEPPAPSLRVSVPGIDDAERSAAARRRGTSPGRLAADLRGELDWIVQRALAKEPQQRYQSAGSLAADVQRHLVGAAIEAAPPSAAYRVRKFVRCYPAAVAAGIAVVASLAAVAGISLGYGIRESRLRLAAERAQTRAEQAESQTRAKADELEQVAKFQESQLAGVEPATMGMRLRSGLLEKARAAAARAPAASQEAEERRTELEQLIAGSDFTGLALESLSETFFEPARAAIERDFAGQPLLKARLLQSLATTLEEVGLLDAASEPQHEALRIRREVLGGEGRDTLASQVSLGLLLLAQGEFAEAEACLRPAIDAARRVLGEDDPVTLSANATLGVVLRGQGRLSEAERYYRAALENERRVLGEEHSETLRALSNLGSLLFAQARPAEAELYFREALEKSRRVLGDEHADTLTAINNLGALLQAQGKFEEAEPYYRESLDTARRILGDEHPDTLRFINNIGYLLFSQQRLAEAETFYREALKTRRRVLGGEHPATLNSLNNLAGLLKEQGRLDEAEDCYVEALDGRRRILGEEHPDTVNSLNNMGWLREAQGRLTEAEPYYEEALEKNRRLLGAEHPSTLVSIVNMSSLRLGQGAPAEAIALLTDAEPAVRRVFTGANVVRLGRFLTLLGQARIAVGDFEAAESSLTEANEILKSAAGASAKQRREVVGRLVDLYDAWHAAEPQSGFDAQAAQWRAQLEAMPSNATATQP